MSPSQPDEEPRTGCVEATYWDRVALELQAYRASVGNPSYAEIAQRITARRVAQGATREAARIARTTVYDACRPGRKRLDLDLHREIAAALGASHDEVEAWLRRARLVDAPTAEVPVPVEPASVRSVLGLLVGGVMLNLLGRELVDVLHLPLYLDMAGTAIAAMALGPWRGAAVGATTNALGVLGSGWVSLPFAIVNVVGALAWGYGVRRWGLGRTLPRFLGLNVLVALLCSLIAVPILLALGDAVDHGLGDITDNLGEFTDRVGVALGLANVMSSVGDKVLSGFVALVVISVLPAALRRGSGLVLVESGPESPAHGA
ncbi:hypothetical protein [Nocardioides gilvus]|uniref:hypothetical protein n=1 Tax=Nocardioides gilvus TaxID=1735589 RepID=UPI000D7453E8|nr:hypothetical protein [Nocardioides gilvus]